MATETAAKTQSQPVMLSDLQDRIMWACLRYQFMTIPDIAALIGCPPTLNHYRRVTAHLSGGTKDQVPGHFLYKWALPKTRWGNATRVFVPGDRSRELLDQWRDKDGMTWNYPAKMHNYSYSYVYHNLAVTRLAILAELFCREHPAYTLAELRLWHDMHRRPPRVSLGEEAEKTTISVIPDLWMYLHRVADGRGHVFWFEIDNATQYRQNFVRRVRARLALIEAEGYAEYFGTPAVLLCYAILGRSPAIAKARLENLCEWTKDFLAKEQREEWSSVFRFAVIEYEALYEQQDHLLTASIWHGPGKPGKTATQPLIPPPPAMEQTDEQNNAALATHAIP